MTHAHHHHDHLGHAAVTTGHAAFATAVVCNLLFTLVEVVYAFKAHSMGLLADAGHNFGDVLGLLMSWGAAVFLKRHASERYSYGYKKMTILSALANALLLVLTTAFVAYEAIEKLIRPHDELSTTLVVVVALAGIVINGGTALLFFKDKKNDLNIKSAFLHLAYDALISVGVVIAAIIIHVTHQIWIDSVVALAIVAILSLGSWNLLRHSIDLILGAVPYGVDQQAVRDYLMQIPGTTDVHDLHIWGLSTQETALTAHLVMPENFLSDQDYQRIHLKLKESFKINHITLQVEKGHAAYPCVQAFVC